MTRRISKKALLEAIKDSGGIMTTIARKLDVAWNTAYTKIHGDPETLQAYQDECERVLDLAEGTIIKSIQAGDTQDAKWLLARKGKKRGYGDNVDVTSGGKALNWKEFISGGTDTDASGE